MAHLKSTFIWINFISNPKFKAQIRFISWINFLMRKRRSKRVLNFLTTQTNPKLSWRRIPGRVQGILRIPPKKIPTDISTPQSQPVKSKTKFLQMYVLTILSSAIDHNRKSPVLLAFTGICWCSPINLYFLYVQGFWQPVLLAIFLIFPLRRDK